MRVGDCAVSMMCLSVAGCALLTSSPPRLVGSWGGVNRELVASAAGLRYQVNCLDIYVNEASLMEDHGSFSGSGAIASGPITGRPATIQVRLRGDTALVGYTLQLADSTYWNALTPPDTLIHGIPWIEGHRDCPV